MEALKISPSLQARIANPPAITQPVTPVAMMSQEIPQGVTGNTVEAKSENNKLAVGIAAAAGVAALATTAILMFRARGDKAVKMVPNGKIAQEALKVEEAAEKLVSEALGTEKAARGLGSEALKFADDCREKGQRMIDDVLSIFERGKGSEEIILESGNAVKFSRYDFGQVMEEFADGKLTREAALTTDNSLNIADYIQKVRVGSSNGKLCTYAEGYEELADGGLKEAKGFLFNDGKLSRYSKGYERLANGDYKEAESLFFIDDKVSYYSKGYEQLASGSWKEAEKLFFDINGQVSSYSKGLEWLPDGWKEAENLFFIGGRVGCYNRGIEQLVGECQKEAESLLFEDGKWVKFNPLVDQP